MFESPPYTAVMECSPTLRPEVEYVATPEAFNMPLPRTVAPSLKVTVPVGVFEPFVVTVAVNVTDEPADAGFALDTTVVVVLDEVAVTVSTTAGEVLRALLASPP